MASQKIVINNVITGMALFGNEFTTGTAITMKAENIHLCSIGVQRLHVP